MRTLLVFTEINQKFGALRNQHGLSSISAVLKAQGYPQVGSSHHADQLDLAKWEQDLKDFAPDLVGFYATAEQFMYVRQMVERVPKGIFTIVGGPHPTCYPNCLENVPRLDAICVGEGEYPMLELLQILELDRDPSGIANLWVRRNGNITRNPTRPFIQNLNELPYQDRELFNTQEAIDQYGFAQLRMIASRGCPNRCTYCSNHIIRKTQEGRYVRFRSAEHILGELAECKAKYKFEEVVFDDDIFTAKREIVDEFSRRYPGEIGRPFVFAGHVQSCTRETLSKLKQAGARRIDFGLESGSEWLRKTVMKRRMSNRQIIEAMKLAHEVGLQVKTLNMVGLPEETPTMFMETVRINQIVKPEVASMSVFHPYPGTELYDYCLEKGYIKADEALPDNFASRRETVLEMPFFTKKAIARCARWFGFLVYWKFDPIKAVGYRVIYSKHGEAILELTKKFRKVLRKVLKGF